MRYEQVNTTWPALIPPITREEAERAARKLYTRFGGKEHGVPWQRYDVKFMRVRTCWITRMPNKGPWKGWHRLVHDISHEIARARQPRIRPHGGGHAYLEKEMVAYVVEQGWLNGKLQPKPKPRLTTDEKHAVKLKSIEARMVTWSRKRKRAETALAKLAREHRRLHRNLQETAP